MKWLDSGSCKLQTAVLDVIGNDGHVAEIQGCVNLVHEVEGGGPATAGEFHEHDMLGLLNDA